MNPFPAPRNKRGERFTEMEKTKTTKTMGAALLGGVAVLAATAGLAREKARDLTPQQRDAYLQAIGKTAGMVGDAEAKARAIRKRNDSASPACP